MATNRVPGKGKPLGGNDLESMLESFRTRRKGRENEKSVPVARPRVTDAGTPARVSEKQSPHYNYTGEKMPRASESEDDFVPEPDSEPELPRVSVTEELKKKEREREERLREEKEKLGLKVKLQDNVSERNIIAEAAAHVSTIDEYAGSTQKSQQKEKPAKKAVGKTDMKRINARSLLDMEGGVRSAIILAEILGKPGSMRDF